MTVRELIQALMQETESLDVEVVVDPPVSGPIPHEIVAIDFDGLEVHIVVRSTVRGTN